jgi:hypothetical protein
MSQLTKQRFKAKITKCFKEILMKNVTHLPERAIGFPSTHPNLDYGSDRTSSVLLNKKNTFLFEFGVSLVCFFARLS